MPATKRSIQENRSKTKPVLYGNFLQINAYSAISLAISYINYSNCGLCSIQGVPIKVPIKADCDFLPQY